MTINRQTTEKLYRDLRQGLHTFVSRRVSSKEDAEDIVQDVFARIHTNSEQLEHVKSVSGWIYRVTRNAISDHHRSRGAAARLIKKLTHEPEAIAAETEPTAAADLARCVAPFVAQLQDEYRDALTLSELGELTQKEAAKQVGLSNSRMKSRVQRARAKLGEAFRNCCEIELDERQKIIHYQRRNPGDDPCGC